MKLPVLLAAFFLVAGTDVYAEDPPDVADLKAAASEFASKLKAYKGARSAVSAELKTVTTELNDYDLKFPSQHLQIRAEQISKALAKPNAFYEKAAIDAADTLYKALPKVLNRDSVNWGDRLAADLLAHLKNATPLSSGNYRPKNIADLQAELDTAEENYAITALERRAPRITALLKLSAVSETIPIKVLATLGEMKASLTQVEKARTPVSLSARTAQDLTTFLELDAVKKASREDPLKSLLATLSANLKPAVPEIHVIQARYGDLAEINRAIKAKKAGRSFTYERSCDARDAMVNRCEREGACQLPSNPQDTLCGYDPAPYVEDRDRVTYLVYACVTGDDARWAELQATRGLGISKAETAILRSDQQTVKCRVDTPTEEADE